MFMRIPALSQNRISSQNKIRTGILIALPGKLDNVGFRSVLYGLPPIVRAGNYRV
jgi:hypothetical protein